MCYGLVRYFLTLTLHIGWVINLESFTFPHTFLYLPISKHLHQKVLFLYIQWQIVIPVFWSIQISNCSYSSFSSPEQCFNPLYSPSLFLYYACIHLSCADSQSAATRFLLFVHKFHFYAWKSFRAFILFSFLVVTFLPNLCCQSIWISFYCIIHSHYVLCNSPGR